MTLSPAETPLQQKTKEDLLLGLCLGGRYTLQRKIGQGTTGVVYEAQQQDPTRRVAVKIIHPHITATPLTLARFQREAQALASLNHPYAVKLIEHGEDRGLRWIALEWLEGETLEERLSREKNLPEEEVVSLLKMLCEVLLEAHHRGILHRDIKPSNIFLVKTLSERGFIAKLLDFGLSSLQGSDALTSSEMISGTPRYMSPEHWDGLSKTGESSDVYSLGVVGYECLSGDFPFDADSPLAWVKKLDKEQPQHLSAAMRGRPISEWLCALLMKSVEKDPARRVQTIQELLRGLEAKRTTKTPQRRYWLGALVCAPLFLFLVAPRKEPTQQQQPIPTTKPRPALPIATTQPSPAEPPKSAPALTKTRTPTKEPSKTRPTTDEPLPPNEKPNLLRGDLKEPL